VAERIRIKVTSQFLAYIVKIEKENEKKKKAEGKSELVVNQGKKKEEKQVEFRPEPIKDPRVVLALQLMKVMIVT
jgi:hypothetical protein